MSIYSVFFIISYKVYFEPKVARFNAYYFEMVLREAAMLEIGSNFQIDNRTIANPES